MVCIKTSSYQSIQVKDLFRSDDVLNDGEEIPEHLQMIVHDNPNDDIYYDIPFNFEHMKKYAHLENIKGR